MANTYAKPTDARARKPAALLAGLLAAVTLVACGAQDVDTSEETNAVEIASQEYQRSQQQRRAQSTIGVAVALLSCGSNPIVHPYSIGFVVGLGAGYVYNDDGQLCATPGQGICAKGAIAGGAAIAGTVAILPSQWQKGACLRTVYPGEPTPRYDRWQIGVGAAGVGAAWTGTQLPLGAFGRAGGNAFCMPWEDISVAPPPSTRATFLQHLLANAPKQFNATGPQFTLAFNGLDSRDGSAYNASLTCRITALAGKAQLP